MVGRCTRGDVLARGSGCRRRPTFPTTGRILSGTTKLPSNSQLFYHLPSTQRSLIEHLPNLPPCRLVFPFSMFLHVSIGPTMARFSPWNPPSCHPDPRDPTGEGLLHTIFRRAHTGKTDWLEGIRKQPRFVTTAGSPQWPRYCIFEERGRLSRIAHYLARVTTWRSGVGSAYPL